MIEKAELLEAIRTALKERVEQHVRASQKARGDSTHSDSKAESKYDTRATEAGYLANGLAMQAEQAAIDLDIVSEMVPRDIKPDDAIGLGVLVELRLPTNTLWVFLVPAAGGVKIQVGDIEVNLVSPESPLAQKLQGRKVGQRLDRPPAEIVSVR